MNKWNPIYWLRSRLTMRRVDYLFTDMVVHKSVYLFEDCFGVEWMAHSKWSARMRRRDGK